MRATHLLLKSRAIIRPLYQPRRHFSSQSRLVSHHGHTRFDEYNAIRYDKEWQERIIEREEAIFEKWSEITSTEQKIWRDHVFKRTDPGIVD